MKRSRKISFHIFYLTPVHSSSLYVGGASFDILAAATQDHWLWSWETQFHSCFGTGLQQTTTQRGRVGYWQCARPESPRVPASWRADRVNAGDFIIPLEGEASLWASQRCRARCLLLGRALRTIVESDSTVRPLNESLKMTIFLFFEAILFFFFSVIRKCFSLSRILNRNLMFGKDACVHAKRLHSCPTLCNPMDCSPPGSSVHGDSLGKNTGVGCHVPSSRGSSWPRDWIHVS